MRLIYFLTISLLIFSCSTKKEKVDKHVQNSDINSLFEKNIKKKIIQVDSLKNYCCLNEEFLKLKQVNYKVETKYSDNDTLDVIQKSIIIDDSIIIKFITKTKGTTSNQIIIYNQTLLTEKKLVGDMFCVESEIDFDFNLLKCYKHVKKIIIIGQPSRWCGKANEYDLYQIIDPEKKEILQFAEKDNWIKNK